MPDISKLPELADIFGVTVDEILGRNNAVLHDIVFSQMSNAEDYSDTDILEAAELLKPSQIEAVLENTDYHPRVLYDFLAFLSDKTIEKIADEHIDDGAVIAVLLPHLSYRKIDELVKMAKEKGESIDVYVPFLRESTVKKLAFEAFERGGLSEASDYLPFMAEKDVLELMRYASQNNN